MYIKHKVIIAGAGGIGRAAGLIMAEQPDFDCEIFIGDIQLDIAEEACQWIQKGASSLVNIESFEIKQDVVSEHMDYILKSADILLDCLPGSEAPKMAAFAKKYKLHYVNLTEYVDETNQILELAKDAETGFILQSGLAPGYVNILANHLYKDFVSQYGDQQVDQIAMKVGALTRITTNPHYYGFTWSPIGVATEYVKDAIVIRNGIKTTIPSLTETTDILIDGIHYEDDFTSGGAADLPDYFSGKVRNLDYKTIRYPGHYQWVKNQLAEIGSQAHPEIALLDKMKQVIPNVDEDLIILYVGITGKDASGSIRIKERSLRIEPSFVGSHKLKAIQTTTAAPMLEAARMLLSGKYKGPMLQSQIDTQEFLSGSFVQMVFNQKKYRELV
ncbi:MAG: saccharopine dehydrogenase NADP-binding domain-containing protein [Saprospiraceae bacterium]|nr:saccharopine dehydrogenase NADP-binding domain-containing protein [Saprospiraceae bacterium]MBK7737465.1 saccharopine dehydrogenase NADP-binding domain-containing protein [Saprospiraceae bacterium]MBK7913955.1 saccharopine dehydrogenase NADP-binding domain-containing protein [Saprospiraceae bacterium]